MFYQNAPDWYNPQEKARRENVEAVTTTEYEPYKVTPAILEQTEQTRVAPFTRLQDIAARIAEQEGANGDYNDIFRRSQGAVLDALGRNITSQVQPFIQRATANPVEAAREYMNPYNQAVIENIGKYGSRNLLENILPNVQDQFIRAGQYGSTGHQNLTNRAIRDTQEAVAREQANALRGGYSEALQTATGQQERQLQGGQLLGGSVGRDIEHQIGGGRELQNLSESQQQARQRSAGFIGQIGGLQQQQAQNVRNTAYEDAMKQRDWPFTQAARRAYLTGGFQLPSQQYQSGYLPQAPAPSAWSQGAGFLGALSGALGNSQRQGYAHGGHVERRKSHIRHYADGGAIPTNPIQLGVNDALDTTEINFMRDQAAKLAQPQNDPFWSGVIKAGLNYATNPQLGGGLGKLAGAFGEGYNEYERQLANQDQRNMAAVKLHDMIGKTRQWQMKHNLDISKQKHDIEYDNERLGLEKSRLGIAQSELGMKQAEHDRDMKLSNLLKTNQGVYEITKDQSGNTSLKNLTPELLISSKSTGTNALKKANEEAAKDATKRLTADPDLNHTLSRMRELSEKLNTGPLVGRVAQMSSTAGSLLGVGKPEDIEEYDKLTNEFVTAMRGTLKGPVAQGMMKILEAGKPGLTRYPGTNINLIDGMQELRKLKNQHDLFVIDVIRNGGDAGQAEKAFTQYSDARLNKWLKNPKEEFLKKPEDFLNIDDNTKANFNKSESQISDSSQDEWSNLGKRLQ